jgi:FdhD protein
MSVRKYEGIKTDGEKVVHVTDHLAVEHPLSISVNAEPFTLTMHTPGHEEDLIRGLLFSEGVYKKREGKLNILITDTSDEDYISKVNVHIAEGDFDKSQINKRNLLSVASCGICGRTELQDFRGEGKGERGDLKGEIEKGRLLVERSEGAQNVIPERTNDASPRGAKYCSEEGLRGMFEMLRGGQVGFELSGGSHAAGAFDKDGKMLVSREDIGRHNAVDKVVGHLLNTGQLKQAKYLLVSGRVSYEIVTKCFTAGIPILAAVSAPSSLAVDFAKELGITLYGFCRENRATRYS